MSRVIKWGAIMGPSPVIVHDIPVAILRFSLKYVFNASELDDVVMPMPEPGRGRRMVDKYFILQGFYRQMCICILSGAFLPTVESAECQEVGEEGVGHRGEQQGKHDK